MLEARRLDLLRQLDASEQRMKDFQSVETLSNSPLRREKVGDALDSMASSFSGRATNIRQGPPSVLHESSSIYTILASDSNVTSANIRPITQPIKSQASSDLQKASVESDVFKYLHRETDSPIKQYDLEEFALKDDTDINRSVATVSKDSSYDFDVTYRDSPPTSNILHPRMTVHSAAEAENDHDMSDLSVDSTDITIPRIFERRIVMSSLSSSSSESKDSEDWQLITASAASIRGTAIPSRFDITSIVPGSDESFTRLSHEKLRSSIITSSIDSQAEDIINQIEEMSLSWRQRQHPANAIEESVRKPIEESAPKKTDIVQESISPSLSSSATNVTTAISTIQSPPKSASVDSPTSSQASPSVPYHIFQPYSSQSMKAFRNVESEGSNSSSSRGSGPTSPLLNRSALSEKSYQVNIKDESLSSSDLSFDSSGSSDAAAVALARKIIYGSPTVDSVNTRDLAPGNNDSDLDSESSSKSAEELIRQAQGSSSRARDVIQREIATMRARLLRLVKSASSSTSPSSESHGADLSQSELSDAMTDSTLSHDLEKSQGSEKENTSSILSDDSIEKRPKEPPRRGIADIGISSLVKPNLSQPRLPPSYLEPTALDEQRQGDSTLSMHDLLGLNTSDRQDDDSFHSASPFKHAERASQSEWSTSSSNDSETLDITNDSDDFDIANLLSSTSKPAATANASLQPTLSYQLALQDSILSAATTVHSSGLDLTTISIVSTSDLVTTPTASPAKKT